MLHPHWLRVRMCVCATQEQLIKALLVLAEGGGQLPLLARPKFGTSAGKSASISPIMGASVIAWLSHLTMREGFETKNELLHFPHQGCVSLQIESSLCAVGRL